MKIDGFSPNLNKKLHIGHFRNLVLGNSLSRILDAKPVALLGATLGILENAQTELEEWFNFVNYHPEIYKDIELKVESQEFKEGQGKYIGCMIWNNEVMIRSDGRSTYSGYEYVFAKQVKPDYYLTGIEQKEHFIKLNLQDKFLGMGLLIGSEGKLKSREGTAPLLKDVFEQAKNKLKEAKDKDSLAYNILAFNCLLPSRETNLQFNLDQWISPKNPGMYVSYLQVRIKSVVDKLQKKESIKDTKYLDARLKSIKAKDSSYLAKYVFGLSKELSSLYTNGGRILGGTQELQDLIRDKYFNLILAFNDLGLKVIDKI